MLKMNFKEKNGTKTEGFFIKTKYTGGNLAIAIDVIVNDKPTAISMLTVNLPESSAKENFAFIIDKDAIINYLINNRIATPTGIVAFRGCHVYPEFEFNKELLNSMKTFRLMKIK